MDSAIALITTNGHHGAWPWPEHPVYAHSGGSSESAGLHREACWPATPARWASAPATVSCHGKIPVVAVRRLSGQTGYLLPHLAQSAMSSTPSSYPGASGSECRGSRRRCHRCGSAEYRTPVLHLCAISPPWGTCSVGQCLSVATT